MALMGFNKLRFLMLLMLFHFQYVCSAKQQAVNKYTDPQAPTNKESIVLGGLFPIRHDRNGKCGELRIEKMQRAEGMVYAVRTINADSSLLPNVNLTFDIRDTCSNVNVALESSIKYMDNEVISCASNGTVDNAVSGIVGAGFSRISIPTANLFRLFQVPQISYASTAAILSDSSKFDYFFRTVPSDNFQATAMADLIFNFNWTYVFALYSDDTYGREGIESLIEKLQKHNGTKSYCIALKAALPTSSTKNEVYDNVVKEMSQDWVSNASVAVLFGHLGEAVEMMKAIKRATNGTSALQRITWIASDSWALTLPEMYHNLARGMISFLTHPGRVADFRRYFDNLNPDTSENPWFQDYWELVFNCSLDNPSCNDRETRDLSHMETSSKVAYVIDAVYAFAHAVDHMIADHCSNGRLCDEISITRPVGKAINGTMLREYLYNVSFPSTFSSGSDLLFDSNGDAQGSYLITNLQFTDNASSFETIGTWDHINLLQLTGNIEWNGDSEDPPLSDCSLPCGAGQEPRQVADQGQCCWECVPCLGENTVSFGQKCIECGNRMMPNSDKSSCVDIPVTHFNWTSPFAISILCLTCIGFVIALIVGALFIIFHRKTVIKASSRELSAFVLMGILLCYILPFIFVAKPSPAVCGVRRFAIGFCFAITYSALLVRSNRIHRIFNQSSSKISNPPRFISAFSQVVFTSILISIQVLIAVIWLAVENPSVKIQQVDAKTVELRCGESPYYGLSVSLGYNLFLLLSSTYFGFLTRKVPDNFNEAKYISITLYSLCVIWVGFVPAYFVSIQFGTVYENFFLLLAVFLSASTTLLCLLMPKIFVVLRQGRKNKSEKTIDTSTNAVSTINTATSKLTV